jgi:trehalose 2-sulfotransferase
MHTVSLLFTRRFDFPLRHGRPAKQLMIAAVPRAGSTAFCLDLWRTGLLGAPLEYANLYLMNQIPDARWKKLLRREPVFWRELQRVRTAPNGVFSYKFLVQAYVEILRQKPKLLPFISATHVVYLTRCDKLAQAISYSRAIRTGDWYAKVNGSAQAQCEYSEAHIQDCLNEISRQEMAWQQVFDITDTQPLRVSYEDFLTAPAAVVQRVLDYVVPGENVHRFLQIPGLEVQRDSVSHDWKQRFLARALAHQAPECR